MVFHETELTPETLARLKLNKGKVPAKVVVLGKLLLSIEGLTTRDALWALRQAHRFTLVKKTKTLGVKNG